MADYITIPVENLMAEGYRAEAVNVTASEVRDVLTSSHMHCGWETTRKGELEPCGKEAVAIRYDEWNGTVSEVCKAHAHRILVPLSFIAHVASTIHVNGGGE